MQLRSLRVVAAAAAMFFPSLLPSSAANPTPTASMMKPIQAALAAVNSMSAAPVRSGVYASNATIVDEFAPFAWSGSNAGVAWANTFAAFAKKNRLVAKGTMMPVKVFDQAADRAYIVVPCKFGGTMNGKPANETGTWTFTLHRSGTSWLIDTQSWGTVSSSM